MLNCVYSRKLLGRLEFVNASSVGAAYIAIVIAGAGVFVRKIFLPGDSNAGYIASGVMTIICIYILHKMTERCKVNHK